MAATAIEETGQSEAVQAAAQVPWKPKHNPWLIALTVTLATFMEVLDTSIANVALPHIAGSLGASQDEATWVITSYLVANAIILPASAYLTTFVGRKKFYMSCVVLFGISSAMCGLAPSLPILILFRLLQGAGGGGLGPSEQAILADTFEPKQRGQAFALYGLAVVAAPAIGPTLGGWITDNYDWRWIFFINVPVAILSLVLTTRMVEDPPHIVAEVQESKRTGIRLDYVGFSLLALGFGSLEFVLDKGQEDDWFGSHLITLFTVICGAALIALILWSLLSIRRGRRPILNLTLFKQRSFAAAFTMLFVLGFALYGTTVLIPQFVQTLLGYTAELAGLVISPGGVTIMLMMPVVGILITRVDPRVMITFGFALQTFSLLLMHQMLALDSSFKTIMWLRIIQAASLAFLFIPINTIAYNNIPRSQNNDVSGLSNLARNIGGSVGTSFVATMLARRAQTHQTFLVSHATASTNAFNNRVSSIAGFLQGSSGPGSGNHSDAVAAAQANIYNMVHNQSQMLAYLDIIAVLAIFCLCVTPLVWIVPKPKGGGDAPAH
ncbi:DHA2 family efflux MFS transporter permease subunit [Terriglobus aquaticus]|uniref:DHA2 family efflux MFS transporter permease subunit n=1 Tax=Terriglobus aquaticus TaxID=940139 RepID=A0ABW9KI48_9BACT|nr:DHA2 family efflux MFS transporter permease subunit [Terriglobus aquaticus]